MCVYIYIYYYKLLRFLSNTFLLLYYYHPEKIRVKKFFSFKQEIEEINADFQGTNFKTMKQ